MTILAAVVVLTLAVAAGSASGPGRVAAAVAMTLVIAVAGFRALKRYRTFPPEPEIADVSEYGLKYVCTMCGLELKVEVAARDKPPTHCGEPMELVQVPGRSPLRPL